MLVSTLLFIESQSIKSTMKFYNLFSFQYMDDDGNHDFTSTGAIVLYCILGIAALGALIYFCLRKK